MKQNYFQKKYTVLDVNIQERLNKAISIKEIKHVLLCLLQNNFRGGEVLLEIEKSRR